MQRNRFKGPSPAVIRKAAGITILAFLLAELMAAPFSASLSSVFSSPEKSDFVLSDFYAQVADRRPVRRLSDKIVIIDIDRAGREEIAELLEIVALCQPTAIAVDINFEEPHKDDSRLLAALHTGCPLILPLGLQNSQQSGNKFEITDCPFFYDSLPGPAYGAVNLPGKFTGATIREFPVKFTLDNGTQLLSFVAAITKETSPEAFERLMDRDSDLEIINFPSTEIPVMSIDDIYARPEYLTDKIVMVGAVNEASDMHSTPVKHSMAGIAIHAHALSTVIHDEYFTGIPKYIDYILASILCFCILLYSLSVTAKVKGLIFRLIQVALVYAVVRIGYELYVDHRIVANFSITLLMIAFGLFALDLWNGSIGLCELISGWYRTAKKKLCK